jgi:hypothetical protein
VRCHCSCIVENSCWNEFPPDSINEFYRSIEIENNVPKYLDKNMTQTTQASRTFNPIFFVSLGIVFWLEALLCIRLGGASLFVNGNPWLMFWLVASIPIAWCLVTASAIVTNVRGDDLLTAVVIMALTASSLDGIALTWFPGWYGLAPAGLLLAAAWLLWGVGLSLGIGYWASRQ